VVYSLGSASTGSVTSSVTRTHKNVKFGGTAGKEVVIFFSTKLYRDHIESYLSELGYSELVQGQLEKKAFSLVVSLVLERPNTSCSMIISIELLEQARLDCVHSRFS
jgi:hypothetical protein